MIYFAGVLAGSLGTSIVDPTVKLAGASGGVYALITAHVATIIMVSFIVFFRFCSFNVVFLFFYVRGYGMLVILALFFLFV